MTFWNDFHGPNAGYLIDLYDRYRRDPGSVDADTRQTFDRLSPDERAQLEGLLARPVETTIRVGATPDAATAALAAKAVNLAQSIRWYGHFAAQLDPLGSPPPGDPSLLLETHGLAEEDLRRLPASLVGGVAGDAAARRGGTALDAIRNLRSTYSTTIGFDYLQNRDPEQRQWLREAAESRRYEPDILSGSTDGRSQGATLLERLTQVEAFELFLQRAFPGKTRFSIEGLDMLVPVLDEMIRCSAESGIYNILLGMAHRGRLNVLAHILNKPVDDILAEFKDPLKRYMHQNDPLGFTGDVKYHAGAQNIIDEDNNPETLNLSIVMAPNPSHLEAVNPVVAGMARAAGTDASQAGPGKFDPAVTLPVVIHGDAAFPGEGVVAETLNLYRLQGYSTGGTIHIIANNQIGFTTDTDESRSTLFASDLAKGFRMPIIHVNADDPVACLTAIRTAFEYRARFRRDFVIDLIGYRRRGHNEGDEPGFTQPKLYQKIEQHPTVRQIWADRLAEAGLVNQETAQRMLQERLDGLQQALDRLDPDALREPIPAPPPPGAARSVRTRVAAETLLELNRSLLQLPEGFTLHPRLARIRQRRQAAGPAADGQSGQAGEQRVDWSTAEELAFATILADGIPIRLTGQDVERGTFSHRHAVLFDVNSGSRHIPLQALPQARAAFEVYNSPLSEYAALGFEFGYNVHSPERLVIWEAQYGDFINNAQTVVDEFIVSARDKWGQLPSLVLLLPHGYEGQGPDHSSGRLERFLGLAADNNLRVANCTTTANYFHLLRRQALLLDVDPLPLVVMTPKSLLRHPLIASPFLDFSEGGWQPVIDRMRLPERQGEPAPELAPPEDVRRLLVCSGKVYVDLVTSELAEQHPETGVVRLEQLAPFPLDELRVVIDRYPKLERLAWVQEEPENMGAWDYARGSLEQLAQERGVTLTCAARPRSASPAEGSTTLHAHNQRRLIENAFGESGKNSNGKTAHTKTRSMQKKVKS